MSWRVGRVGEQEVLCELEFTMPKARSEAEGFAMSLLETAQECAAGRANWFSEWPQRAAAHTVDVVDGLFGVARRTQFAIDHAVGAELAVAIATAEQMRCFCVVEGETTSLLSDAHVMLTTVIDSAEASSLDAEACEALVERSIRVPLPLSARLSVVAVPLDAMDLALGINSKRTPAVRLAPAVVPDAMPMAMLDGGCPTPRLISRFEARAGEAEFGDGKTLAVATQLDQWWGVRVMLDGAAATHAEGVRIGPLALERHSDDHGLWQGSLRDFDLATQLRLLAVDICVRLSGDRRFLL
jgi:hypothetical protein